MDQPSIYDKYSQGLDRFHTDFVISGFGVRGLGVGYASASGEITDTSITLIFDGLRRQGPQPPLLNPKATHPRPQTLNCKFLSGTSREARTSNPVPSIANRSQVHLAMWEKIRQRGLAPARNAEMVFVPVLAYLETRGIGYLPSRFSSSPLFYSRYRS